MSTTETQWDPGEAAKAIDALVHRAEKAEDLAAYWQAQAEHLKKVLHAVELLDCSAVAIENNGGESLPWEITVSAIVDHDWRRWETRGQYYGATLLQALERLAKREVAP